MRWNELDETAKVWTVPPARMKAAREHRVPLSKRALAVLVEAKKARVGDFVFPDHALLGRFRSWRWKWFSVA